jgi:magnesium chelatase family protein
LLDRIDIDIEVPRVEYEKLSESHRAEDSACIQARVEAARQIQRRRFGGNGHLSGAEPVSGPVCNADMQAASMRLPKCASTARWTKPAGC